MGLTDLNEGERKHNGCSRFQQVAIAVLHAHALRTKGGGEQPRTSGRVAQHLLAL